MSDTAKDEAQRLLAKSWIKPFARGVASGYSGVVVATGIKEDTLEPLVIYQRTIRGDLLWAQNLGDWPDVLGWTHPAAPRPQELLAGSRIAPYQIHRHFEGGLYVVIATAIRVHTEEPLIVYASNLKGSIWIRTLENWLERVDSGQPSQMVPRFERARD